MPKNAHPCPADPPCWYYAAYEEGPWYRGFSDLEDTVSEAIGQGVYNEIASPEAAGAWQVMVHLAWACSTHLDLSRVFRAARWTEQVVDELDETFGPDEDGDHPLYELTGDDQRSLEEAVRTAIWHWQHRRQLPLRTYWLTFMGAAHQVVRPHPDDEGAAARVTP